MERQCHGNVAYLEQRIPPFVRSQPHWCSKNLTPVELKPLIAAATEIEDAEFGIALYAHPTIGAAIVEFPSGFLAWLKAADESALRAIAERWAATMSTPDFTHSVSGERLYDDWTVDDALSILNPMMELAKQHRDGQSMYLLIEA